MVIKDQKEALCVACEMERRAIRTYERTLLIVTDEAVAQAVRKILGDEREHLRRFMEMKNDTGCIVDNEERLIIAALGAEALFPGGVMEFARKDGLSSVRGLYTFARDSEDDALHNYNSFAERCDDPKVKEAFRAIAREEAKHLASLNAALKEMEG